jgi:pyruvate formate lyase activating enzyme
MPTAYRLWTAIVLAQEARAREAGDVTGVTARFWHRREDGRLVCDLCPRHCALADGMRGLCFVRERRGDRIVLTTYGRSSGFCVDPIEKKPLFHFLPGTAVLSFGTAGCNLTCRYCQNWDISRARETDVLADEAPPGDIAAAAERVGARSVAFTYNDPVVFHEYALDTAAACRERGIATVAVTAGYVCPEPRAEFYAAMDAANIDLKALDDDFYRRWCGGRLEPVLDTLRYVAAETGVWLEITTLLIPGLNDDEAAVGRLAAWIAAELGAEVPLHLTAFHPAFRMLDRSPTPPATIAAARRVARGEGLHHVYSGNVHDPDGQATRCAVCGDRLIGRSGYTLTSWHLDSTGRCSGCGTPLPGVFDARPGSWGARRMPVRLGEA